MGLSVIVGILLWRLFAIARWRRRARRQGPRIVARHDDSGGNAGAVRAGRKP